MIRKETYKNYAINRLRVGVHEEIRRLQKRYNQFGGNPQTIIISKPNKKFTGGKFRSNSTMFAEDTGENGLEQ